MARTFEEIFSECQANMIRASMKYVDFREEVELAYTYVSFERNDTLSWNCFYKINGKIVSPGKLNNALPSGKKPFDVSSKKNRETIHAMLGDILRIQEACNEFGREMPTEIKIIYNAKTHKVSADYNYDPLVPDDPDLPYDGEEKWMAEEAAKLGQVI